MKIMKLSKPSKLRGCLRFSPCFKKNTGTRHHSVITVGEHREEEKTFAHTARLRNVKNNVFSFDGRSAQAYLWT